MGCSASVSELPAWASALLSLERVARLGLIDDAGRPRVLPVTYAVTGRSLVTAVDDKRKQVSRERVARIRWLRQRPRAAITVDHYAEDWSALAWVQAVGHARVLDASDAPDAIAALVARYEQYRDAPPGGPVIALDPERLVWWRASESAGRAGDGG